VIVTHEKDLASLGHETVRIEDGRLISVGPSEAVGEPVAGDAMERQD
jgi:ABC-type lipoprotein export system ATPase subunit